MNGIEFVPKFPRFDFILFCLVGADQLLGTPGHGFPSFPLLLLAPLYIVPRIVLEHVFSFVQLSATKLGSAAVEITHCQIS